MNAAQKDALVEFNKLMYPDSDIPDADGKSKGIFNRKKK